MIKSFFIYYSPDFEFIYFCNILRIDEVRWIFVPNIIAEQQTPSCPLSLHRTVQNYNEIKVQNTQDIVIPLLLYYEPVKLPEFQPKCNIQMQQ